MLHSCFGIGDTTLGVTISADTADFNLFTAAGSPSGIVNVVCIVLDGVTVSASSTGNSAFTTGAFAAGSTVKITNNGTIVGKQGTGGAGATGANNGSAGNRGGPAMDLSCDITLDNTYGSIFGGGGGGGGGGGVGLTTGQRLNGGDGGRGSGPSANWTSGDAGQSSGPNHGGTGGRGGGYGSKGANGANGHVDASYSGAGFSGGSGASGGKAIALNGYAITWLGGNNTTQVKGAVA